MRRTLATLTAGLAICALACEEAPEPKLSGTPVVLSQVELRILNERIEAPGELLAKNRAEIAAEVAGQVTEIRVDDGEPVEGGGIVLEIDPERRRLELDDARARLAEAQAAEAERGREVERYRKLRKRDVASKAQLDAAETGLSTARSRVLAARASVGGAERALRDSSVAAPFSGLIARRRAQRGEYVQPGQPLFELVSLDPIEVEFHLAEVDSARVEIGQGVDVRVAPYPDEVFRATVSVISPTIDRRTRTLRVKALLPNAEGRLRPGLFARVDLGVARRSDVTMIPEEAVLQRSDGAIVFRLGSENRVERLVIGTGLYRDGWVEVTHGLAGRDTIVRRGHNELIDGSVVLPRNPDGTPTVAAPGSGNGHEEPRE
jgi:membrane fusion protein (multidrug efflux system)